MEDLFGDLAGGGEVERVLCVVQETHVYKIPPRQSSEGHRANDWNGNHLWTGRCRVVGKGDKCEIKLEEADGARTACAAAALLPTRRRSLCLQTVPAQHIAEPRAEPATPPRRQALRIFGRSGRR